MVRKRKATPKRITNEEAESRSYSLSEGGDSAQQEVINNQPPKKKQRTDYHTSYNPKELGEIHPICTLLIDTEVPITFRDSVCSQQFTIHYTIQATGTNPLTISLTQKESGSLIIQECLSEDKIISARSSAGLILPTPSQATILALAHCVTSKEPILYLHFLLEPNGLKIDICVYEKSFQSSNASYLRQTIVQRSTRQVMDWCFPAMAEITLSRKESLTKDGEEMNPYLFYSQIRPTGNEPSLQEAPALLNVTLRNYQSRAAQWMIHREQVKNSRRDDPTWAKVPCDSIALYYNPFYGVFNRDLPSLSYGVSGGILADEMGLGKSIELLACILSHPNSLLEKEIDSYKNKMNDKVEEAKEKMKIDGVIKCYCRHHENSGVDQNYIECEMCFTWQHMNCVGYEANESEDELYLCPDCAFRAKEKLPSNTTLIICPTAILQQWRHEIVRRTSLTALKILIYEGITMPNRKNQLQDSSKEKAKRIILPQHLAQFDIVLTTYETLRGDLNHSKIYIKDGKPKEKRGARKQRYRSLPTPLTGLTWWRVCIDEAQMVGSSTAKAAEMALQLSAMNRWCITGTPIQRGLHDLRGLFMFLQLPVLSESHLFRQFIEQPMEYKETRELALQRLAALTKDFFWRSSKEDVKSELSIPPQGEKIHSLRLTPVEAHFYKKRHEACSEATLDVLIRSREQRLTAKQMSSLLNSLLRLRQACCHPQIGSHSTGIQIQRTPLTMEQLLDQLILKAKIECEESQRQWIVACSALAALLILQAQRTNDSIHAIEAAKLYREMIRVSNENRNLFEVDAIQQLHMYHNLSALLGMVPSDPAGSYSKEIFTAQGRSVLDNELLVKVQDLREQYSSKNKLLFLQARNTCQQSQSKVEKLISGVNSKRGKQSPWWERVFLEDAVRRHEQDIVMKIRESLMDVNGRILHYRNHPKNLANRFVNTEQLRFVIKAEIFQLHKLRENILTDLKSNEPAGDNDTLLKQVRELIECPCRSSGLNHTLHKCHSCTTFQTIAEYEQCLFFDSTFGNSNAQVDGLSRTKHDSDLVIVLQALIRSLPSYLTENTMIHDIRSDLDIIRGMSKEIKHIRQLWEAQRNYFLSVDELQQACSRIQLLEESEVVHDTEKSFKILPYEIIPLTQKYSGEQKVSWLALAQRKGQLKYLGNLDTKQKMNVSTSDEECVICREKMGDQLVILACGHEFCGECVTALIVRSRGTLKCPSCRTRMNSDEIAYVSSLPVERIQVRSEAMEDHEETTIEAPQDSISVTGSWGTKIEAVVRELLRIKESEPNAKSLVFSQWTEVLEIIHQALTQNNITATMLQSSNGKKQHAALHAYRFLSSISVLLLPLKKGANGLNLTEATHVFLVEPLLNPAAEAQAIGRVHRIGQTQKTVVHRFVVENTVEEKLHSINQKRKEIHAERMNQDWKVKLTEKECMTTADLCELFEISEDQVDNTMDETPIRFPQPAVDRFWNALVRFDGKVLPRSVAAKQLERAYSLRLLNSRNLSQPRVCNLYSIEVPQAIVKKLVDLPEVHVDDELNP